MRLRIHFPILILSILAHCGAFAQATLFQENFDDCVLSPGWQVNISGNPNLVWYVGDAVQNDDNNGQSMNGSCFLFIDDDATGDNTPPFVIDFVSPPIDVAQYPTVELSLDVHYRDWGQAQEYLDILLYDGTTETLLRRFDQTNQTGSNLDQFATLKYDLALLANTPTVQLIIRYDDAGGYGWWAGVDNILVVGKGEGANVVSETFNDCAKPAGWETEVLAGEYDWSFGKATNPKAAGGPSMDGSCMAYFDDDLIGDTAAYSTARLYGPWFDGSEFSNFELNFDLIHRYYSEIFTVLVQNGDGEEVSVASWAEDVGGPLFNNYVHQTLDLSPFRAKEMRVVFEYADGNAWAWWSGIDNVKITGSGAANDLCTNAININTGEECKAGDNRNAVFDGPLPPCAGKAVASLWYYWTADFTGVARITTQADFNDVVSVFTGNCALPAEIRCDNRDEHGFTGEGTRFDAVAGTSYYIRVAGDDGSFGRPRGSLCIRIDPVPGYPPAPVNDGCAEAQTLLVDGPCLGGTNLNAATATVPSLNELARADVWYKFTAPALTPGQVLEVRSNADFSDIITLYSGGCAGLTEIAGNHKGQKLELPPLTAGQSYWIQIAGTFATVEGSLCAQIAKKQDDTPANDNCLQALNVSLGGQCVAASNLGATFSGYQPPCVVQAERDVWFKFTAPASGNVQFNTGADFEHVVAVWQGSCNNLSPVFCAENPLRCEGYLHVGNLVPGQTYYVQIASRNSPAGLAAGSVCLSLLDGAAQPPFQALSLQVEEQCIDIDLARLSIEASGGIPPYGWLGAADGQTLASGSSYLVIVSDANGCEQALTGIVDECTEAGCFLAATFVAQNPVCAGESTGSITVIPEGGSEPYSFAWSNNQTGATATNLAAGAYFVTITDAEACTTVGVQTLTDPAVLLVSTNVAQPASGLCNGSIGLAIMDNPGTLTFNWTLDGQFFSDEQNLSALCPGLYALSITDQNGCTHTLSVQLTPAVGTADPAEEIFAEIQPNPLKDKGQLVVRLPSASDLFLSLNDSQGRKLRDWSAGTVLAQNIPLELGDLPQGIYWLKITAGERVAVRKVVVAR